MAVFLCYLVRHKLLTIIVRNAPILVSTSDHASQLFFLGKEK
jgi:hypothetical protein